MIIIIAARPRSKRLSAAARPLEARPVAVHPPPVRVGPQLDPPFVRPSVIRPFIQSRSRLFNRERAAQSGCRVCPRGSLSLRRLRRPRVSRIPRPLYIASRQNMLSRACASSQAVCCGLWQEQQRVHWAASSWLYDLTSNKFLANRKPVSPNMCTVPSPRHQSTGAILLPMAPS